MPRYKNEGSTPATWQGTTWAPGQESDALLFCPPSIGLTKISDLPAVPGVILLSCDVTVGAGESREVAIAYPVSGRAWISCVPVSGSAAVRLGDGAAMIPLDDTTGWGCEVCWLWADRVAVSSVSGGAVRILVEEIPGISPKPVDRS